VGGGGQPRTKDVKGAVTARQAGLFGVDERCALRRSHENPIVQQLYRNWLG
jgi:hypothetical protein